MKKICALLVCLFAVVHLCANQEEHKNTSTRPQADLILFSYNRPMQLFSLIESIQKLVTGVSSTQVIYRVTEDKFEQGYELVKKYFPTVQFVKQGPDAPKDFKPLVLKAVLNDSKSDYIMFGVDDIIVTEQVDVSECIEAIEKHNAYGFFLRLGKNITECYTICETVGTPELTSVGNDMYTWKFSDANGDWSLPASVDMCIYRKVDVRSLFPQLPFHFPNNFEAYWSRYVTKDKIGLCYGHSKIINIPLNIVQEVTTHRNMSFLSPDEMLDMFKLGLKIDIEAVSNKKNGGPINKAPHVELVPSFIKR